ncbi:histidine kinase [Microbacterium sp. EYE_5]|uniref:sensor histidine kinase n=1 Tax=unclassified Microbacterium TaxID=2609290 RepID=UPI002005E81C|nr:MULTISPECIES: histidine kinase [unclassified Microbacterium]MCK6081691.1 histidine kinase [Microbacterium sp. EYE_382]MCK6086961.1 histidine kinase [Microbacterium sp. EYE_384]MCK6123541.1 histidine kinase [Microbacterium sp. EYE_80]MCK6126450.1 histidine kinase [Microbacterium sp. EYE_79]MCK6142645.1 histidine kinase [Microbacterium sp. EYE_39]
MTSPDPTPTRTAVSLARGVTATGWYIATSMVSFLLITLFMWGVVVLYARGGWRDPVTLVGFISLSAALVAATVLLLVRYRRDGDLDERDRPSGRRRFLSLPVVLGVLASILLGVVCGSILFAASLIGSTLCLVRWGPGIRWRGVVLLEVSLVLLWFLDLASAAPGSDAFVLAFFAVLLPLTQALSLWSWDVVLELDRARRTEARLAAVQERLRLAGELHDLQGHHLQVIALQLELAERMLARDPDAAVAQIRLARASVDEARDGTRALAGRFRGVPLPDELANAADLLRAAGLEVTLDVAADAASAPADLLGPVIRECTTNVLKHGGGRWARLGLDRAGGGWRLTAANDPGTGSAIGAGAGLEGIAHRVGVVGGDVSSSRDEDRFELVVTVPAERGMT